jgi:hypothetical protein
MFPKYHGTVNCYYVSKTLAKTGSFSSTDSARLFGESAAVMVKEHGGFGGVSRRLTSYSIDLLHVQFLSSSNPSDIGTAATSSIFCENGHFSLPLLRFHTYIPSTSEPEISTGTSKKALSTNT